MITEDTTVEMETIETETETETEITGEIVMMIEIGAGGIHRQTILRRIR